MQLCVSAEVLRCNGVKHYLSAPYQPSTNGVVKRAVQIFKQGLKKLATGSRNEKINHFLLNYRITPQTTGTSPVEMLTGSLEARSNIEMENDIDATLPSQPEGRQSPNISVPTPSPTCLNQRHYPKE